MLKDIVNVQPLEGYRIALRFEDGTAGEVDLQHIIRFEGIFAPLKDRAVFIQVCVHPELGTIYWPTGADLDPDVLYAAITGKPIPEFHVKT